jgi:hypothetical protein
MSNPDGLKRVRSFDAAWKAPPRRGEGMQTVRLGVQVGGEDFPSECSAEAFKVLRKGKKLPMEGGHQAKVTHSSVRQGILALDLLNKNGDNYAYVTLLRDQHGTMCVMRAEPTPYGESNPNERKGRVKELRRILAPMFGGIASDWVPENTFASIRSYYRDSQAIRTIPEKDDNQKRLKLGAYLLDPPRGIENKRSRFFTPGSEQQWKRLEKVLEQTYGKVPTMTDAWLDDVERRLTGKHPKKK